jgi:transposase
VSIINDRCNYLRKIKSFREAGYDIVCLDETWANQNHFTDYMWLPNDGSDATNISSGKGKRLIVLHAGTRNEGLINGCDLVFLAKSMDGYYQQEMNRFVFLEWLENQLMPALKNPSLVVLYNASYHNVKTEDTVCPNFSQKNAVLQNYITQHSIPFTATDTKKGLYEKIKQKNTPVVYKINSIANLHGHEVVRTPIRHCEHNTIELIWAQVKGFVAKNNTTFRLKGVKELTYATFGKITKDMWTKAEEHVVKIEKEYCKEHCIDRSVIQPIIIDFCDDDSV